MQLEVQNATNLPARDADKTGGAVITHDYLTQSLARTVGLRREKRAVPQMLLAENNGFYQRLLGDLFIKDFMVTIARSGADAHDLYIQSAPDIVLLNIGLPDLNGFDVLARILALDPEAYVVMLSGQCSRENVLRSIELGAHDFVGKPFTSEKLFSAISKCHFVQEKRLGAAARGGGFRRRPPGPELH